jgi:hypothetical protein
MIGWGRMVSCVEVLMIQVGGFGGGQVGALAFGLFLYAWIMIGYVQ